MFVTFNLDGGASTFEFSVILMVETITPYLLARRFVRTQADFERLVKMMFWFAVILLPAAAIESFTGARIYNQIFEVVFPTHDWVFYEKRMGMWRAQTVFEHPILYGVMMAFFLAPVYTMARQKRGRGASIVTSLPVIGATFFALSAGGWMGAILQTGLMLWNRVLQQFKNRWKVFAGLVVLAYLIVEFGSNQPPFQFFSTYLAFDAGTAYHRYLILIYGMENVWNTPLFGRGLNDWERPFWMYTPSVDNLWLLMAMRHGIPGFLLMFVGYVAAVTTMVRARPSAQVLRDYRNALVFSLMALGVAIVTVYLWNATYYFMFFMLGAGAWFHEVPQEDQEPGSVQNVPSPSIHRRAASATSRASNRPQKKAQTPTFSRRSATNRSSPP